MSQFLLDPLGRCLKLFVSTESTSSHDFASQFGVAFFYTRKTPQQLTEDLRPREWLFEWTRERSLIASDPSKRGVNCDTVMRQRPKEQRQPERRRRCVYARAHARERARAYVRACVGVCMCVFAIYENNIWPRLIMIIIKIRILFFIHITHTDDFPSTGTRLVHNNYKHAWSKMNLYWLNLLDRSRLQVTNWYVSLSVCLSVILAPTRTVDGSIHAMPHPDLVLSPLQRLKADTRGDMIYCPTITFLDKNNVYTTSGIM